MARSIRSTRWESVLLPLQDLSPYQGIDDKTQQTEQVCNLEHLVPTGWGELGTAASNKYLDAELAIKGISEITKSEAFRARGSCHFAKHRSRGGTTMSHSSSHSQRDSGEWCLSGHDISFQRSDKEEGYAALCLRVKCACH